MSRHNIFAGAFVDRSGHRRDDPEWLGAAVRRADARFLPVWQDKCLTAGDPPLIGLLPGTDVSDLVVPDSTIFLGMYRGAPAFAFALCDSTEPAFGEGRVFHDLRYLGGVLSAEEANLAAHARALVAWHAIQSYCGICGSATAAQSGGNTRICTSAGCSTQIFPRVDPAVIVLVADGDRCLLGRQTNWPEGRYSTIAGFVEPGESLEDAVRREVLEETNVRVGEVHYHSSQPWPFPSSLMLGFVAEAESVDIRLNDGELEDAAWFTRKECRSGFPKLPYRVSIARRLVDDWLEADSAPPCA